MGRPVKVDGKWYDTLRMTASRDGITMQEALRRHLEQEVPAVPQDAFDGDGIEHDEQNTGYDWVTWVMIGAIVVLGAILVARFLPQRQQTGEEPRSESGSYIGGYPYPHRHSG